MINVITNKAVNNFMAGLRDKSTTPADFRNYLESISLGLAFEMSNSISTKQIKVSTPLEETSCEVFDGELVLLPILRAGLGMLPPFSKIFPAAKVEYQVLQRDEATYGISSYYTSYKSFNSNSKIFILDPMIATGNTLCSAIETLRINGATDINIASIIAAPQGIENVLTLFPNVNIWTCALDRDLNSNSYILPGLGDAGDRMNGCQP